MRYLIYICLSLISLQLLAQKERKEIREGNELYSSENYEKAETQYRKALEEESNSYEASFNLGNSLFKQEKYEDAENQFRALPKESMDKEDLSKIYYNLGNTLLASGKLQESIEAYKKSLRNNPSDMAAKYNLSYALNLLKDQQNQQNQQQQQDQQNQDQKQQDQQKQQQEKQEQQQQKQEQEQQQQQANKDDQKQGEEKQEMVKISKEDAQRILQALENEEKDIRLKVEKEKAKSQKVRVLKDW